jgi:EF-P beta-lysylation protein EpmB
LSQTITKPEALFAALGLDAGLLPAARAANETFALRVPASFVARMKPGDPDDPLLRQVLPVAAELEEQPGFVPDPLEEAAATRAPGLLQKYAGRALLIATAACAVHCRYCFRREFPYSQQTSDQTSDQGGRWTAALAQIAGDPSIEEVILSGGDPLSLSDARLRQITDSLNAMPHVERVRVHTRTPVVMPARVDAGLIEWVATIRQPVVFVLHVNHPNEIDADVHAACARLRAAGVTLLNQSVLLAGVNDEVDTLKRLSVALMDAGVLPYYLHLPDRVRGTAHFDVAESRAKELVHGLTSQLSGYLVPRLVREIPGKPSKTPV